MTLPEIDGIEPEGRAREVVLSIRRAEPLILDCSIDRISASD